MTGLAVKAKDEIEPTVDIEAAKKFMKYSTSTLYRRINKAKAGKSTFPYRQDGRKCPYKFIISELKLWQWNVTQGITT